MTYKNNNTPHEYNHPHYINIPFFVLQDERLDFFNKFLFSVFWGFSLSGKQIKPSNGYLATLFKVDESYIGKRIKELEDMGFIRRTVVRYRRVIEVLYTPKQDIEIDENSTKLELVPPAGGRSTKIELGTPTGGGGVLLQEEGGTPTGVPDIIDYKKEDIKETHTRGSVDNFSLEKTLYLDSEQQRKAIAFREMCLRDAKARGKHSVLNTDKTFEEVLDECISHYASQQVPQLVSPQRLQSWINREARFAKTESFNKQKYPSPEERAANEQKIRERELKAQEEKRREINAAKSFKSMGGVLASMQTRIGFSEAMKQREEEMKRLGMNANEYDAHVLSMARDYAHA